MGILDRPIEIIFASETKELFDFWNGFGANIAARHQYPEAIQAGSAAVAMAFIDGDPAGWAAIRFKGVHPRLRRVCQVLEQTFPNEERKTPYGHSLFVKEEFRGMGIGTALTVEREKLIVQRTDVMPRMAITVRSTNYPSIRLHEKLGYDPIKINGQRIFRVIIPNGAYTGQRESSLIMVKDLR